MPNAGAYRLIGKLRIPTEPKGCELGWFFPQMFGLQQRNRAEIRAVGSRSGSLKTRMACLLPMLMSERSTMTIDTSAMQRIGIR